MPAAEEAGLKAVKADDIYGNKPIISDIWRSIWTARVVIADVSGKNPNVNYELGLCHALGVPTILITQDLKDVPFDYRHLRCIVYDRRRVKWQEKLRSAIVLTIKAVLSDEDRVDDLKWPYDTSALQVDGFAGQFVEAEQARDFISRGIVQARDALSIAFGVHGAFISVSSPFGGDRSHRSGHAISAAQLSNNPLIQLGLDQVRAVTFETFSELGDGTKIAALLFSEMVLSGFAAINWGSPQRDLIHDMDLSIETAVSYLNYISRGVDGDDQLRGVATTAAVGDVMSGQLAFDSLQNAGDDGVVYLEDSTNQETNTLVRKGMFFDRGYISNQFVTDEPQQLATLENAYILLASVRISGMRDIRGDRARCR